MKPAFISLLVTGALMAFLMSCISIPTSYEETYYVTEFVTENRSEPFSEIVDVATTITGEDMLSPCISWGAAAFAFKAVKHVWYHGYDLSALPAHASETIKVMFSPQQFYEYTSVSIFNMAPRGQILAPPTILATDEPPPSGFRREILTMTGDSSTFQEWLDMANFKLNFALLLGGRSDLWLNYEGPCTVECNTRGARDIAVIISGPSRPQNMRFNVARTWSDTTNRQVMRTSERSVTYQVEKKTPRKRMVTGTRQAPFWEIFLPK